MVGLIARYAGKIVIATGPSREAAEEIALQLFSEAGYELRGVQIPLVIFDTEEIGGLLLDPDDVTPFEFKGEDTPSMDDWTVDGWLGPTDADDGEGQSSSDDPPEYPEQQ